MIGPTLNSQCEGNMWQQLKGNVQLASNLPFLKIHSAELLETVVAMPNNYHHSRDRLLWLFYQEVKYQSAVSMAHVFAP